MRYLIVTVLTLSSAIYALFIFCDTPVVAAFNSAQDAALQSIAEDGLRLYFLAVPFAGCNIALSFFFTSIGRALPAHCISLLRGLWRCALLAQHADKQSRQIKRKTAHLSGFFTFCERYQSIFSGGSANR